VRRADGGRRGLRALTRRQCKHAFIVSRKHVGFLT
jgi:hypothetical protein